MTEEKATELFNKWARIFRLESWDIRFQWRVRVGDMNMENALGCTSFRHESRQAIVQMLDPVDFDNALFEYDYEKTLVHELLHIKFADLDDTGDPLRDKLTHQMINDLAIAFVACERSCKPC